MKKSILSAGLICFAFGASAAEITIALPDGIEVSTETALYKCGEKDVNATYYNAGDIALVKLELGPETIVAANVISASGAKYAAGTYVWWTKGETADLYDLMNDPEQTKPVSCTAQDKK